MIKNLETSLSPNLKLKPHLLRSRKIEYLKQTFQYKNSKRVNHTCPDICNMYLLFDNLRIHIINTC